MYTEATTIPEDRLKNRIRTSTCVLTTSVLTTFIFYGHSSNKSLLVSFVFLQVRLQQQISEELSKKPMVTAIGIVTADKELSRVGRRGGDHTIKFYPLRKRADDARRSPRPSSVSANETTDAACEILPSSTITLDHHLQLCKND